MVVAIVCDLHGLFCKCTSLGKLSVTCLKLGISCLFRNILPSHLQSTRNITMRREERRRYARLDMALTVAYRVVDTQGGKLSEYSDARSSDISASGLRLMTPAQLEVGTRLELEIFLERDEDKIVRAIGEVVWQSKTSETSFETGVVIKHMDDADKGLFMQFVFDQMSKAVGLA